MRIVLHDYSGHPFQAQLSRQLARRGHEVFHLFSAEFQTPKGRLQKDAGDPEGLTFRPLTSGEVFRKDTFVKRRAQEEKFGRIVAKAIEDIRPDVVISSNAPLDAQARIQEASRRVGAAFVFWIQDIYSEAIQRILAQKIPVGGRLIGAWYQRLEYSLLRRSDAVVAISEDFVPILARNGVNPAAVTVVENWAPLDEIATSAGSAPPSRPRPQFLYSGTLGYKHNPDLLLRLARELPIDVVVHSEGRVADELARKAAEAGASLVVKPWVPFDALPQTLGAADVLLAVIEPDAGVFSVPSKVLTYLCVGRPILAAVPKENLAARTLVREGAGLVSDPADEEAMLDNARLLAGDAARRDAMGHAGRAYAERAFDIEMLGARFEAVIADALEAMTGKVAA